MDNGELGEGELQIESRGFSDSSTGRSAKLAGIVLVACGLYLAVSLAGWQPGDPQLLPNYPEPDEVANPGGRMGALAASFLFTLHGIGAYVFPLVIVVLGVAVLSEKLRRLVLRYVAAGVLLVTVATLFGGIGWVSSSGLMRSWARWRSVAGAGGVFGVHLALLLEKNVGAAGTYIVAGTLLLAAVALAAGRLFDYSCASVVRLARRVLFVMFRRNRRMTGEEVEAVLESRSPVVFERSHGGSRRVTFEVTSASPAAAASEKKPDAGERAESKDKAGDGRGGAIVVAPDTEAAGKQNQPKAQKGSKKDGGPVAGRAGKGKRKAAASGGISTLPPFSLLDREPPPKREDAELVAQKGVLLIRTLREYGIETRVLSSQRGPVITLYELERVPGKKITTLNNLAGDISVALGVQNVRIVAPLPGKNTIGVEVPNNKLDVVRLRSILESPTFSADDYQIPLVFGRDSAGSPLVVDLASLPHLLIAGATGSGKSVCLNGILLSLLMTRTPEEIGLVLVDPKRVEMLPYRGIPHLLSPVICDMRKAAGVLDWAVREMETRYVQLGRVGVRNIAAYNNLTPEERRSRLEPGEDDDLPEDMRQIIIMIDELSDLMLVASREVETSLARLAQKARAVGIHIILATQKPYADVITGIVKANMTARVAFQVMSGVDSRTILDTVGAERLVGQGDMLYQSPTSAWLTRGKGVFVTEEEVSAVVQYVRKRGRPEFVAKADTGFGSVSHDKLYEKAVGVVVEEGRGSASLLQRKLGIGFTRAGRLIDTMASEGILGPYPGDNKARRVIRKKSKDETGNTRDSRTAAAS